MAWANPDNIKTNNVDANTDSPALARADIKTAFDELSNIANNSYIAYTPSFTATQGTVTITYTTQQGFYVPMGGLTYLDVFIHANILYSDAPGFSSQLTMNLPVASATTSTHEAGNSLRTLLADSVSSSTWPTTLEWQNDPKFFVELTASSSTAGFKMIKTAGAGVSSGLAKNIPIISDFNGNINSGDGNMALKVQGFYLT